MAKGRRAIGRSPYLEAWLLERWGVADAGAAPYALFADGGDPGEAWWLCAEPSHLRVNLDHLVPTDATPFDVVYAEAEGLVESLNRHFAAVGLAFFPLRPDRWYVRSTAPLDDAPPPLAAVRGQRLDSPAGRGSARFNALTNEIQMVLHGHAANLSGLRNPKGGSLRWLSQKIPST